MTPTINRLRHWAWLLAVACLGGGLPLLAQIPGPASVGPASGAPVPSAQEPSTSTTADPAVNSSAADAGNTTHGQATSAGKVVLSNLAKNVPAPPAPTGTLVDQVVAVVNGELVLESDVDEERRFVAFEPFSSGDAQDRDKAIERLIDRTLILQQSKLQPDQGVSADDVQKQLLQLRKDLPECRRSQCETGAGWEEFVAAQGFTLRQLEERWMQRLQILRFVELRFRSGVDITPAEARDYYTNTMLPAYKKANAVAPKLEVLYPRIEELLLEQRVSALLSDWLQSLKAEGTVRVMRPGEVEP